MPSKAPIRIPTDLVHARKIKGEMTDAEMRRLGVSRQVTDDLNNSKLQKKDMLFAQFQKMFHAVGGIRNPRTPTVDSMSDPSTAAAAIETMDAVINAGRLVPAGGLSLLSEQNPQRVGVVRMRKSSLGEEEKDYLALPHDLSFAVRHQRTTNKHLADFQRLLLLAVKGDHEAEADFLLANTALLASQGIWRATDKGLFSLNAEPLEYIQKAFITFGKDDDLDTEEPDDLASQIKLSSEREKLRILVNDDLTYPDFRVMCASFIAKADLTLRLFTRDWGEGQEEVWDKKIVRFVTPVHIAIHGLVVTAPEMEAVRILAPEKWSLEIDAQRDLCYDEGGFTTTNLKRNFVLNGVDDLLKARASDPAQ